MLLGTFPLFLKILCFCASASTNQQDNVNLYNFLSLRNVSGFHGTAWSTFRILWDTPVGVTMAQANLDCSAKDSLAHIVGAPAIFVRKH